MTEYAETPIVSHRQGENEMHIVRKDGYPNGTVGIIDSDIVIMKWSTNWWSAFDGSKRAWGTTALRALKSL